MEHTLTAESSDFLFEAVEEDIIGENKRGTFDAHLEGLCAAGFLEIISISDDQIVYKARTGTTWSNTTDLADPVKKKIVLQLIDNPKCFFVLQNTQRGKLRIIGKEIASWTDPKKPQYPGKRIVSFLVVDNNKTLAEQSTNGLFDCFPIKEGQESNPDPSQKHNVKIFELSSNNKITVEQIIYYIDAYAYNPSYSPPLIVLLNNASQIQKLLTILDHAINHECPHLCVGGGWDEADLTYPQFRSKNFSIPGKTVNFLQLLGNDRFLRNGWVTATEGNLLDEEYEECANAYCYPYEISPSDAENYLSYHHEESKKHYVTVRSRESNNVIATRVLEDNWASHFAIPLKLRDGSDYHHKVIVNSDSKAEDMAKFARSFTDRAFVLTFNMYGVKLYSGDHPLGKRYPIRKQNLNKLLYYIYKMNRLETKPLFIIGRRKVDRGLGFHYAPRKSGTPVLRIDGPDGPLTTDGVEGLIWTDIILGNKIEHIPTAVQKAGRGAGIVRQCPQYPNVFHYWVEEDTSRAIEHHYKKVDAVNNLVGSNSILQAVSHAEAIIPLVRRNHGVDLNTCRVVLGSTPEETLDLMKRIIGDIFNDTFRRPHQDGSGKFKTSLNGPSVVAQLLEAVKKVPGGWGNSNGVRVYRRYFPCYKNIEDANSLYCVIPLIDTAYTAEQKTQLDTRYGSYFKTIPQEGEIPE